MHTSFSTETNRTPTDTKSRVIVTTYRPEEEGGPVYVHGPWHTNASDTYADLARASGTTLDLAWGN